MKKNMPRLIFAILFAFLIPQTALAFCNDNVPSQYLAAAQDLFNKGVLQGYSDGSCKLNNPINRAETVTFILRNRFGQLKTDDVQYNKGWNDYNIDQLKREWFGPFIAKGNELGIIKGDANNNLRPANQVIDSEGLVMILRSEFTVPKESSGQNWYDPAYQIANSVNMSTGNPGANLNRGDVVRLIFEMNQKKSELQNAISNYVPRIGSNLKKIADQLETIDPAEAANIYNNMSDEQSIALEALASDFNWTIHVGACTADQSLILVTPMGLMDCEKSKTNFEKVLKAFDQTKAEQFAMRLVYGRLLVYLRESCANKEYSGDITAQTCSDFLAQVQPTIDQYKSNRNTGPYFEPSQNTSYTPSYTSTTNYDPSVYKIMSDMSASMHNTNMSVINNIGGGTNCLLGELNCVPF